MKLIRFGCLTLLLILLPLPGQLARAEVCPSSLSLPAGWEARTHDGLTILRDEQRRAQLVIARYRLADGVPLSRAMERSLALRRRAEQDRAGGQLRLGAVHARQRGAQQWLHYAGEDPLRARHLSNLMLGEGPWLINLRLEVQDSSPDDFRALRRLLFAGLLGSQGSGARCVGGVALAALPAVPLPSARPWLSTPLALLP